MENENKETKTQETTSPTSTASPAPTTATGEKPAASPTPAPAPAKQTPAPVASISTKILINHDGAAATALIGIQRTGCDPIFFTAGGGLLTIFGMLPTFLADAGLKWKSSPYNPKATVTETPVETKPAQTPTTKPTVAKPTSPKFGEMSNMF